MADDPRGGRGYPPREQPKDTHYPPPPEEDDRRAHQQPSTTPNTMTLPPFNSYASVSQGYPPEQRYAEPRYPSERYAPEQRYDSKGNWSESPTNQNGYSAPPPRAYEPQPPPSQPPRERTQYDRPPDGRGYDPRYEDRARYSDPYYQQPPPSGRGGGYPSGPDPYGYRYQPPGPYPGYHDYPRGGPNIPPVTAPPPQQAAPRQRTSIACRYCRKRKIRCSGYANTTNGKCTNCDKLRIECIFQPVSSNSSTAFVPVSAVPGGVPPGTPLYGAYGQPLPPTPGQSQQGQPQQGQPRAYPPPPPSDYASSLHSPTSQYPQYEDRDRDPGRRRTRPPEEEHGIRLPPPNYPVDDDPRRRSPASTQSNGTPPTMYQQYQPSGYDQDRAPTPHRNSPGGPPPVSAPPQPPAAQSFGNRNPMSLNVLMRPDTDNRPSGSDIDMSMKSKLDSRRA
ncbi:hypothetical protein B0T16DRAFT_450932 [Cercophora newfieldiana]|uniref:Zn(2)-C6 fungal-type domain-containing protein n=1 Tax=Cercophora newfieldiana TaxID=92897 RepID=A0AA40CXI4_9PEZI|nr:hypothetical protein B0T16DRAFT_450932 [Cercophora newfieldiana]